MKHSSFKFLLCMVLFLSFQSIYGSHSSSNPQPVVRKRIQHDPYAFGRQLVLTRQSVSSSSPTPHSDGLAEISDSSVSSRSSLQSSDDGRSDSLSIQSSARSSNGTSSALVPTSSFTFLQGNDDRGLVLPQAANFDDAQNLYTLLFLQSLGHRYFFQNGIVVLCEVFTVESLGSFQVLQPSIARAEQQVFPQDSNHQMVAPLSIESVQGPVSASSFMQSNSTNVSQGARAASYAEFRNKRNSNPMFHIK